LAFVGFGSTGLEVQQGWEKWRGTRVWLALGKLGSEKMHTALKSTESDAPYPAPGEWEKEPRVCSYPPNILPFMATNPPPLAFVLESLGDALGTRQQGWSFRSLR